MNPFETKPTHPFTRTICPCGAPVTASTKLGNFCDPCADKQILSNPVCDFCSEPNPSWKYNAHSFTINEINGTMHNSEGAWSACDSCHNLIEKDKWIELAARASANIVSANLIEIRKLSEIGFTLLELHDKFRKHRIGPPTRIKVDA